jgi:protein O-mannosyl-transferase
MKAPAASRLRRVLGPLGVTMATLAVFAPALSNGFVWDDAANIVANPSYRGLGWLELHWMLTSHLMGPWIPLTWATLGLDFLVYGMKPAGYHLTNIVLHAANAVAVYVIAQRLLRLTRAEAGEPATRLGAAAAALVFALHPLRTESVAWVTERRDVLSGLFFLLTLLAYLKAHEGSGRRRWLAASVGCYALAMLSKPIVMSLPFVLVVLDFYPLGRLSPRWREWLSPRARTIWVEKLPYILVALMGGAIAYVDLDQKTPLAQYPPLARLAMLLYSLWFYLWKTLLPLGISPLYELPAQVSPFAPRFATAGLAVVLITIAAWGLRRRWPAGLAIWTSYAVMVAPVGGLVHAGPQLVASRYSYLPCLGWAVLAGAGVAFLVGTADRRQLRPTFAGLGLGVAALSVAGLAGLTSGQVQNWRDEDTLWRSALEVDPACARCHGNLAVSLEARGYYSEAIKHFELALSLRPDSFGNERRNLGLTFLRLGRFPEAVKQFQLHLERSPGDVEVRNYLGVTLMNAGEMNDAVRQLEKAVELDPNHAAALTNLGLAVSATGRPAAAIPYFQRAIRLNPADPLSRFGLASAYQAVGDGPAAREHTQLLQRLDPQLARQLRTPGRPGLAPSLDLRSPDPSTHNGARP